MLHKMGFDCVCYECKAPKTYDEMHENDICVDCHDKWFAEEAAYWKPLYLGEVAAGLVKERGEERTP